MKFMGVVISVLGGLLFFISLFGGKAGDFLPGFVILMIGIWMYTKGKNKQEIEGNKILISELPEFKNADYCHIYAGTAISISKLNQTLFLAQDKIHKTYSFADVRTWSFVNLAGGDGIVGGTALQNFAANKSVHNYNTTRSGLFIQVRDIEMPKWQIKFPYDANLDASLNRWMEILRQLLNEEAQH